MTPTTNIPITVFTGFLGVGKTSIILSLLPQLPEDYKVVLLKNEFGDIEVDSQLAKHSSLAAVSEILNGCMCCVLVGQMKTALLEIREKFRPDRIIIECSGSAFPATLAFQIRELERETNNDLKLDAIITVVDAENFSGYEDTSPTARMQASYSDIILINKWEHVTERALDLVIDHLNTLNDQTPKIKCNGQNGVDPNLLFGVDTKLYKDELPQTNGTSHHDEVQTVTIFKGLLPAPHAQTHSHTHDHDSHASKSCVCLPNGDASRPTPRNDPQTRNQGGGFIDEDLLRSSLEAVPKESVWRIKGFVRLVGGVYILNWAFGRYELKPMSSPSSEDNNTEHIVEDCSVRLTVMGEQGEVRSKIRKFCATLEAEIA